MKIYWRSHEILGLAAAALAIFSPSAVEATPQFARMYRVDCSSCHSAPPKLNQRGEDFLARGYRFDDMPPLPSHQTVPLAVWNTGDIEYRRAQNLTKAYPGRVEIVSGGILAGTRAWYFIEWRPLSLHIGARNRLLNRSGRFEDAVVSVPLGRGNSLGLAVGQFRALSQVDVSRRLSLSEPLAFSAGIPDPRAPTRPRLTALRAFSPSARQPGLRLLYQRAAGTRAADGWYSALTLPLTGELTIPFTDAASFELEARPKGVFGESYLRKGLTSLGGHVFVGDRRSLGNFVVTSDVTRRWSVLGAVGFDRSRDVARARFSVGGEYVVHPLVIVGGRVDHRTGQNRDPAVFVYANGHLPFGPDWFRQALRVQFEQTLQSGNLRSAMALSHIF